MQPYKEGMNVSKLCAERLWQEVENMRVATERKAELQEVVARLRDQRVKDAVASMKAVSAASAKEGYEEGSKWAMQSASYSQIKWLTGVVAPRVEAGERPCDIVEEERRDVYALMPSQEALAQLIEPHDFWVAFLRAVLDLWAQIGDAVEGDEAPPPRSDER